MPAPGRIIFFDNMKRKRNVGLTICPLVLAAGMVAGLFIGKSIYSPHLSPNQLKLLEILGYIESDYVDDINVDSLLEDNFSQLISLLDPHSAYIPASEVAAVNEELDGSFSGVGVSFQVINDTVCVIDIIPGGPAEKVGIVQGDKILRADTVDLTGKGANTENVFKTLRGKKGTKVKLTIDRHDASKPLQFDVVRGSVAVNSVDCSYLMDENVGYVKVNSFSRTTYDEFLKALLSLQGSGAESFIIDLRGNSGGFLDQAILMANEFLDAGRTIVYTKGKNPINQSMAVSDGNGNFPKVPVMVLTDEFSASASEIFAGAIQDNDRGLIVGRRSFGKGLVQNQTPLFDNSALRLTVARYYTPSGRCIQKEYKRGKVDAYDMDISSRLARGEFYHADSIRLDRSKPFRTVNGRTVFGGGGIMPDVFVPEDTTGVTSYFISVRNAGLIQKYAYKVAESHRDMLRDAKTIDDVLRVLPRDFTLLSGFVDYASANGVPARWFYIRQSQNLILHQLKSVIVRDVLGYGPFIEMLNRDDRTIEKALQLVRRKATPMNLGKLNIAFIPTMFNLKRPAFVLHLLT